MYISKLTMHNFRCYKGEKSLYFEKGINYLVGDNNGGKTTIFRAIEFLIYGKNEDDMITKNMGRNAYVAVEVTLKGKDLPALLGASKLIKYEPYLKKTRGNYELRVRRSSKTTVWRDAKGKEKEITIRNLALYNHDNGNYENPTNADSVLTYLFDPQFVYSDLNNEDYQDFGKTKIVGKLINEVTEGFRESEAWKKLESAHNEAFNDKSLKDELEKLQKEIESFMLDQYGEVKVKFDFGIPTIDNFLKTGSIQLEDNGITTDASQKGTGMQRALALSLIQVYAQLDKKKKNADKSILFFLDEPETFLHPRAQDKLLQSLEKLSANSQVFITTHSPYLLKNYNKKNSLKVFRRIAGEVHVNDKAELNIFGQKNPSWAEINYTAFGMVSIEFHIELFGHVHNLAISKNVNINDHITSMDEWLSLFENVPITDEKHVNENPQTHKKDRTMPVYIRNCIDHPDDSCENRLWPTTEEIASSIQFMLDVNDCLKKGENIPIRVVKKNDSANKYLKIEKNNDPNSCAVLTISTSTADFTYTLKHLESQTFRAKVEGADPTDNYLLYIDTPSENTCIQEGYYYLIQKKENPTNNQFGVFLYDNKIFIRQYQKTKKGISLIAHSKNPTIKCSSNEIIFLGQLVKEKKKFRKWKREFLSENDE